MPMTCGRTGFQVAAWQGQSHVLGTWWALDTVLSSRGVRGLPLFITQGTGSCVLG